MYLCFENSRQHFFYLDLLIENLIIKLCIENFDYFFYTCEIYDLVILLIN